MDKALLCYVAVPYTQEVVDILNFLSITYVGYPSDTKFTKEYGLFIYNCILEQEDIDYETFKEALEQYINKPLE